MGGRGRDGPGWALSAIPVDLLPEFLPVISPLDDVVVVAPEVRCAARRVEPVNLRPGSTQSLTVDKQGEHRDALTCSFGPEVGFEPTTFRLREYRAPSSLLHRGVV